MFLTFPALNEQQKFFTSEKFSFKKVYLTLDFLLMVSSVVCRSSEFRDAEQGSLYLEGQAHKGWVQLSLTYTALHT